MTGPNELEPCDMIMKGGLTSGVVYPGTILELSKAHRFVNLGGASAGAIGAAAAAACEYHRREHPDDPGGFQRLEALPTELGQNMLHMIQPAASLTRFWDFVIGEMRRSSAGSGRGMPLRLVGTSMAARPLPAAVGVLVILVAAVVIALLGGGWIAFAVLLALLALVALSAALVLRFGRDTKEAIEANNLGICDGHTPRPGATVTPICDWIDDLFSECATGTKGTVLTFGDLWGDDGVRAHLAAVDAGETNPVSPKVAAARSIDLQVMATNFSMGRPHRFPLETQAFFWCQTCWSSYFSDAVLERLTWNRVPADAGSTAADTREDIEPSPHMCPTHPSEALRYLPGEADLPVIVGVRVSLSFPLLFSAVPFHTVDRNRGRNNQGIERVWFADGGMSSNFPMHFFDSLVPSRPTFGVSLEPQHPDYPDQEVYCPPSPSRGHNSLRITDVSSIAGLTKAMVKTMQNWADNTLLTLPGYRERVVQVRLSPEEGGFNFTMPAETITGLSNRGALAAQALDGFDMDTHRWARYLSSMSLLEHAVLRVDDVADDVEVGTAPVDLNAPDCSHSYLRPPSQAWSQRNQASLEAVQTLAASLRENGEPFAEHHPRPTPNLQVTPRI